MNEFKLRSPGSIKRLWYRLKHWRLYRSFKRAVVIVRADQTTGVQNSDTDHSGG